MTMSRPGSGRFRTTSTPYPDLAFRLETMFRIAKPVGQGMYGEVRSYNLGNQRLVLKLQDHISKTSEETAHVEIWDRMTHGRKSCQRYITRPYPSPHPEISIQQNAIPKHHIGMNLKQYLLSLHPRDKQRLRPVIITEMVSALSCLHNHGAVHSDVKFDNFMVYFKPDNPDAIKLKIIDMGLAAVSRNSKPLVTFKSTPNANFLNTTRLVELLEQAFKTIADNGGGLFANTVFVRPHHKSFAKFDRRHQPLPLSRGRTLESSIINNLGVQPNHVQHVLYDLYKLEDKQARKLQKGFKHSRRHSTPARRPLVQHRGPIGRKRVLS